MTHAEVIAFLREYNSLIKEIKQLDDDAEYLRARLYAPPKMHNDGMPKSNYIVDRTAAQIARLADMDNGILQKLDELIRQKQRIEDAISKLESAERMIVRLRYIACDTYGRRLSWIEVSERAGYSESTCRRIHSGAIDKMTQKGPRKA